MRHDGFGRRCQAGAGLGSVRARVAANQRPADPPPQQERHIGSCELARQHVMVRHGAEAHGVRERGRHGDHETDLLRHHGCITHHRPVVLGLETCVCDKFPKKIVRIGVVICEGLLGIKCLLPFRPLFHLKQKGREFPEASRTKSGSSYACCLEYEKPWDQIRFFCLLDSISHFPCRASPRCDAAQPYVHLAFPNRGETASLSDTSLSVTCVLQR
mmetsp:Transcript_4909/g.8499  ORF Transcript_4909/g.8499 Transcript_4909/m.8499 type:complete len:215 (-) Transcript_4909:125-769(-)